METKNTEMNENRRLCFIKSLIRPLAFGRRNWETDGLITLQLTLDPMLNFTAAFLHQ